MTREQYAQLPSKEKQRILADPRISPAITLDTANNGHYRGHERFPITIAEVVEILNLLE